jgi:hypothetical protein
MSYYPQAHHSQAHQGHYPQGHHAQSHHAQAHHAQGHYSQSHHAQTHHSQTHHGQGHYPQAHHAQAHHSQAHHAQSLPVTRKFLTDGYISYTFTPKIAEFFLVQLLFKVANSASIEAIPDQNGRGAYFVFNHPSLYSPPPLTIHGRGAWVLDYDVKSGGSVVPQQLWFPQGDGDRRRYVDQARFRMPVFFVGIDGSLGVPVLNAAAGHMQLRDAHVPPPLQDKKTVKIRIAVRVLFFFSVLPVPPITDHVVSQWPGYGPSEQQVQLRDQTSDKNPIPFDRFVKHVGSRVRQFLAVRLFWMWQ